MLLKCIYLLCSGMDSDSDKVATKIGAVQVSEVSLSTMV